ncbi:hypothetical protein [Mesoterricola silvestris]|uniref:Uncharacterized protein n=1 Tax=Mesoterricola silvestris TaxID=2927979 RepID=A0AA48GRZ7_9BACT|nr:hypothetical protein [Mesoterricola silvestris]BDU72932.1 hypothetical protein METEAL_21060 [Mesoterricola silvestris]
MKDRPVYPTAPRPTPAAPRRPPLRRLGLTGLSLRIIAGEQIRAPRTPISRKGRG